VPETTGPSAYHNSVISFGVSPPQTYRKSHLVPFSEFIPFKWLIGWVYDDLLNMPLADFTAGAIDQAPFAVAGQKIVMTNCYEDLFGEEIIRKLPQATMLANVSNDAWFGRSWGPQQHLQISQMRAMETGRYMLRATNTGVTAFIDHKGRVLSRAPDFTRMVLDGSAQGYAGATPYVRFGNFAVVILSIVMLAIALVLRTRQRPQ
jgi:apolipoprotein N-acyltransferase